MTDKILAFLDAHLVAVLVTLGVTSLVVLLIAAYLFRQLSGDRYRNTVRAMTRLVQFITGVRKAAKGDATADDELAQTISEPMKAVKKPEAKP